MVVRLLSSACFVVGVFACSSIASLAPAHTGAAAPAPAAAASPARLNPAIGIALENARDADGTLLGLAYSGHFGVVERVERYDQLDGSGGSRPQVRISRYRRINDFAACARLVAALPAVAPSEEWSESMPNISAPVATGASFDPLLVKGICLTREPVAGEAPTAGWVVREADGGPTISRNSGGEPVVRLQFSVGAPELFAVFGVPATDLPQTSNSYSSNEWIDDATVPELKRALAAGGAVRAAALRVIASRLRTVTEVWPLVRVRLARTTDAALVPDILGPGGLVADPLQLAALATVAAPDPRLEAKLNVFIDSAISPEARSASGGEEADAEWPAVRAARPEFAGFGPSPPSEHFARWRRIARAGLIAHRLGDATSRRFAARHADFVIAYVIATRPLTPDEYAGTVLAAADTPAGERIVLSLLAAHDKGTRPDDGAAPAVQSVAVIFLSAFTTPSPALRAELARRCAIGARDGSDRAALEPVTCDYLAARWGDKKAFERFAARIVGYPGSGGSGPIGNALLVGFGKAGIDRLLAFEASDDEAAAKTASWSLCALGPDADPKGRLRAAGKLVVRWPNGPCLYGGSHRTVAGGFALADTLKP